MEDGGLVCHNLDSLNIKASHLAKSTDLDLILVFSFSITQSEGYIYIKKTRKLCAFNVLNL